MQMRCEVEGVEKVGEGTKHRHTQTHTDTHAHTRIHTHTQEPEGLLKDQQSGTFLVRVAESRFGYSLSLIHEGRVKHFMINVRDENEYQVCEPVAYSCC